jgi:uncharacterized protein (DUF2236 family)
VTAALRNDAPLDVGLFGPDSVTWQLHADPAMVIAGFTSLFLEALHPRAVAAIVQNSNFRSDPLGRLFRTADYVALTTYGTSHQARQAGATVRSIHRRLRATDPRTGRGFRIDEPDLLLWVHCAEVSSFLDVTRRAGFPLTDRQADRYLAEQRRGAALVGLHEDEVPGSRAELAAYFAAVQSTLRRTDDAEEIFRFLRWMPVPARYQPLMPAYSVFVAHLAYSLLPDWAIDLFGREPYPSGGATMLVRTLRSGALAVPRWVRRLAPKNHLGQAIERLGPDAAPSPARLPPG